MTRLGWIDALRGLAACAVAMFHFNELPYVGPLPDWLGVWKAFWKFGHAGVPVFFVLSGYCIGIAALRAPAPGDFLTRRARRIFPAYWASVALIVALILVRRAVAGVNDVTALPRSLAEWLATLALVTAPVTKVQPINWVYWSLSFELAFYVLVALALCFRASWRIPALVGISLLATVLALWFPAGSGPLFFLPLWPLFALGLVALFLPARPGAALTIFGSCVGFFTLAAARGEDPLHWAVALLTLGLLIFFRTWPQPVPAGLRLVGECSYSIYLLHVPVACFALRWLTGMPKSPWAEIGLQALQLSVSVAAGWLFYRAFERPFLRPPRAATATAQS
ncbi:MAG: acyltransferase [Verrucomicrobia bacterium]|nr:acyltransferase [Verrucomicrobiota bacterium]